MFGWGCMHGSGWGGIFPMFFGVIFWVVIIIIAYVILKNISNKGGSFISPETPIDILKKRYARGEITKEEFEKMKRDILG